MADAASQPDPDALRDPPEAVAEGVDRIARAAEERERANRTTVEQLRYIREEIEAYLYTSDAIAKPPDATLFVHVDSFNSSSIDFLIYCFTKTTAWTEWLKHKEEFALKLIEIVEAAGTGFAFPSRTLYMQQQDAPEIVHPPSLSENVTKMRALKGQSSAGRNAGAEDGGDG